HSMDGGGPTQGLAAWVDDLAPVELRLGLRFEAPVERRMPDHVHVSDRDSGPDRAVVVAGFKQHYAGRGVRAQAVGGNSAGPAGADDDIGARCSVRGTPRSDER